MANAKKCDRCGVYYDPYVPARRDNPPLNGVDEMQLVGANEAIFKRFELCPTCARFIHAALSTPPSLPAKQ